MDLELKYMNPDHKIFFLKMITTVKFCDIYRAVFFYLMGLSYDTMENIKLLYNFRDNCITPDKMKKNWSWLTLGTRQICNLAFNLYGGYFKKATPDMYTPDFLFSTPMLPYFMEALRLRFSDSSQRILDRAFEEAYSSLQTI